MDQTDSESDASETEAPVSSHAFLLFWMQLFSAANLGTNNSLLTPSRDPPCGTKTRKSEPQTRFNAQSIFVLYSAYQEHPVNPGYFTYRLQSFSAKQRCNYGNFFVLVAVKGATRKREGGKRGERRRKKVKRGQKIITYKSQL